MRNNVRRNSVWNETAEQELIRMLQDMIRIDSSNPPGDESGVADYIKQILDENDIPCTIYEKVPNRSNLVAVIEGDDSANPVLLISHLDVVPVNQADWSFDGFGGHIEDGFLQGRGTVDTKQLTAMELLAFLMIARKRKSLKRTIIFIATADEENGSTFGMQYLTETYPQLFRNPWVLNEGGGFIVSQNDSRYRLCTCGEKGKFSVRVTVGKKDAHGDSLSPDRIMAMLNDLLHRLSSHDSREIITDVMERFRQTVVEKEYSDQTLRNLWEYGVRNDMQIINFHYDAEKLLLDGEPLVLNVDFKTVPGTGEQECRELFRSLIGDAPVEWEVVGFRDGYLSDIDSDFAVALRDVSERLDPGSRILPIIALGNTDGRFIGGDVFGFSPMLADMPFSRILAMIHNKDECISLPSLIYGGRVVYEVLCKLAIEGSE